MENSTEENQPNGEICLEVNSIWKIFGPRAEDLMKSERRLLPKETILKDTGCVIGLRDISFSVKRGEFFVLMGLSGSGKSTLIRCLIRLIDPTAGEILINGRDVCKFNKEQLITFRRKTTGMVFQHFGLLPHYTVLDNVAYGLKVKGVPKAERYERAQEAIETVGLKGWENYLPSSLSGGMQQRVGMARALARDPEILFLDEPFSGLDPLIRRQMQDELMDLQDKLHKTMIFVTHDLQEALKVADRIVILRDGEIVQIGTPEDIIASPADDYVRDFVQDASPAKVLSAGRIMEEPRILLYDWQGPKVARTFLGHDRQLYAFLISRKRKFLGVLTMESIRKIDQKGITVLREDLIKEYLVTDLPTCNPEAVIEDLFPLATSSPYPIPVLDNDCRLLGIIRNETILDSMIQDTEEETSNND